MSDLLDKFRAASNAIFEKRTRVANYVVLGGIYGNRSRDRRLRTVLLKNGARLVLPEGSSPAIYLFTGEVRP